MRSGDPTTEPAESRQRNPETMTIRTKLLSALLLAAAVAMAQPSLASGPPFQAEAQDQPEVPTLEVTLSQAVEMALRYNLQVRISAYSPDLQEEAVNSARSRFDPSLRFDIPSAFNRKVVKQVATAVSRAAHKTHVAHRMPKGTSIYHA